VEGGKDDDSIEVVPSWEKAQCVGASSVSVRSMKGLLSVGMGMNIEKKIGVYTADDITVCVRNGEMEVWTNREFKPKTCMFIAESSEIKDRFWNTVSHSTMTIGGCRMHPEKKNLVIDGRLTAEPMDDALTSGNNTCVIFDGQRVELVSRRVSGKPPTRDVRACHECEAKPTRRMRKYVCMYCFKKL